MQKMHVESNQNAPFKTFIFQQQTTQATAVIKYQLPVYDFVNLKPVLQLLPLQLERCRFKIYNFAKNCYQTLQQASQNINEQKYIVPWSFVKGQIVLIKYVEATKSQIEYRDDISESQSTKKQRSRQRTISQVLAIVKQWRQIHLNQGGKVSNLHPGRKINLQQAAVIIGISKKSLDDYYYQLRLGQKYSFDFKQHLDDKIGVLRMFIKDIKPKGRKMDKNQKHPKRLKILDQLADIQSISSQKSKSMKSSSKKKSNNLNQSQNQNQLIYKNSFDEEKEHQRNNFDNIDFGQQPEEQNPFNPFKNQVPRSIQDQFYNQFEFILNQPHDPFLALENNYDDDIVNLNNNLFSKKNGIKIEEVCKMDTEEKEEKINVKLLNGFINESQNDYFFG